MLRPGHCFGILHTGVPNSKAPWALRQNGARHPVALYGVLLAAAWFVASRASPSRRWLGVGAHLAAEVLGLALASVLTVART